MHGQKFLEGNYIINAINQGILRDSRALVLKVINRQTLILTMEPAVACEWALVLLNCGPGACGKHCFR